MFGFNRPSLALTTLKAAVVIGALTYMAASYLSNGFDTQGLSRLAAGGAPAAPLTTGSILPGLADARLDPCAAPTR